VGVVSRPRRNILPNRIYLVSQEGNKKHPVYIDDQDREFATRLLNTCSMRYGVKVLAFGYGEYEGRWLLRPSTRCELSCLMRDMQSSYSRYLNQKYNHRPCCAQRRKRGRRPCHRGGDPIVNSANWTARFKATEIDAENYLHALEHVRSLNGRGVRRHAPVRPAIKLAIEEALRRRRPLRQVLSDRTRRQRNGLAVAAVRAP